ncbi:hypothetical protein ACHAW6_009662, partial [Cyclotella cf. meneghiniana]
MFSVVSHSDRSSTRPLFRREAASSFNASRGCSLLRFFSARRARQLSEAQLRKKVRKHCDRGDWSRVRTLISNHDFAEVPDVVAETNSNIAKSSSSEGKRSSTNELVQNPTSRRPSYGSRNGERLSFAGKESAAAAAVIKAAAAAAMLEEGSKFDDCSDNSDIKSGENILHDVCRHNPPLDVIELLLTALRHRRGITCSRDNDGRTPLHVAVASGASPHVIEALARADPLPASMGDDDNRSPLHLAVKFLAYQERIMQQSLSLPRCQSSYPRLSKFAFTRKEKRKQRDGNPNNSIFPKENKLDEARQTLMILKNAMITYPGRIDFKDEDNTGFAPLDYAIDGLITDQAILHLLIRRNESRDSQDSLVLKQIEEEEMTARRHRINRIKARDQVIRVEEGLFEVFGIEEAVTPEQFAKEVDDRSCSRHTKLSRDEESEIPKSCGSDIQLPCLFMSVVEQENSTATRGPLELTALSEEQYPEDHVSTHVVEKGMTDEDIYNFHLQAYLADTLHEFLGDLEYCDDLDFLYDDPDDTDCMDEDTSTLNITCAQEGQHVPVFE